MLYHKTAHETPPPNLHRDRLIFRLLIAKVLLDVGIPALEGIDVAHKLDQ